MTLLLVLAAAACLGGAAAMWRPLSQASSPSLTLLDGEPVAVDAMPLDECASCDGSLRDKAPVVRVLYADPTPALRRTWLRSLSGWLLALIAMALIASALGRLRQERRPLPQAARRARPVPALMMLSLILPLVPQLVLIQADEVLLPALLLVLGSASVGTAAAMLIVRRQLAARLRWAVDGPLERLADGTIVAVELRPRRLALPPGRRGRTPWYRADLSGFVAGQVLHAGVEEPVRVALEGALVDARAAHEIASVTFGGPNGSPITVVGATQRVPADAAAADPLARLAPTQARLVGGLEEPAVVFGGTRSEMARRLRLESALLCGILVISVAAVVLTLI